MYYVKITDMKTLSITCILRTLATFGWSQESETVQGVGTTTVTGYLFQAQETSKTRVKRTIQFDGSSEEEKIVIEVRSNTKRFNLEISGAIGAGKFEVEVLDPEGKVKGQFSLSTQAKSSASETVNGYLEKGVSYPQSGEWIIRIIPKKAEGELQINHSFVEERN